MESKSNSPSIDYHKIFDYKLTREELIKWRYKNFKEVTKGTKNKGRLQREMYSRKKLIIAKNAAKLISKIPTVKFVGITGALAMNNAGKDGDIDLMIVTKSNRLWTTRLFVYLLICLFGIQTRKPRSNTEKDRLCLNMWMDENDLIWDKKDRNLYTAHEIAQIMPLVNRNKTYERFLYLNKWILNFWPNAVRIYDTGSRIKEKNKNLTSYILYLISLPSEYLAFRLQYFYMKSKITREIVTPTRAIFHPNDWSKVVIEKFSS
ncbi:MAG: hypothetical protein ACD_19C00015G0015 [uncultured bacterium]|nr:MAG: hypothetical protein ACD_19C00015G0015 [uncultured bacterium]